MNWLTHSIVGPLAVLGLLAGCDVVMGPALRGSGVSKTESREVGDFTEIEVGHAIELDVTVGPATDLVVTADDNILPHLKTEVSGDRLRVYIDASSTTNVQIKVSATVPELHALSGSGAATTSVTNAKGERFRLELSGASKCQLTGDLDLMDIDLSGASQATLTGSAERLAIQSSGASHVYATDFVADKVEAELNGASMAHVNAAKDLNAQASGASTLRYKGRPPQLIQETSGASTIAAE